MSKKLILVLGGARGGKSTYAENLARELGGEAVLFIATAQAFDEEMRARILKHQAARPSGWRTLEAPSLHGTDITNAVGDARVVLLDCLTLLTSNALLLDEAKVEDEVNCLLVAYASGTATWIVVSNEVGLGIVPDNPLARLYRDVLGRANQRLAAQADRVMFLVAGLPMRLK
jgi:adenosylcobinamide kinase/adenosylcobinamide-phosphate guanylyltransferase